MLQPCGHQWWRQLVTGLGVRAWEIFRVDDTDRQILAEHGDPDYLLHVIARDSRAFQHMYDEQLAALPGVQRLTTTLVMKDVVLDRPLPI